MSDTGKIVALVKALAPVADQETVDSAVETYLDNHPEATTTVQDGSITEAKLASALAQKVNQVTSLSDEIDDVGSDVTDLKSALNDNINPIKKDLYTDLLTGQPLTEKWFVDNSTGVGRTEGAFSSFLNVRIPEDTEMLYPYDANASILGYAIRSIAFYDTNGTFISGVYGTGSTVTNGIVVPDGAVSLAATIVGGEYAYRELYLATVKGNPVSLGFENVDGLSAFQTQTEADIESLQETRDDLIYETHTDLLYGRTKTDKWFVNNSTGVGTTNGVFCSYVDVPIPDGTAMLYPYNNFNTSNPTDIYIRAISFYDTNGAFISGVSGNSSQVINGVAVPSGAKKVTASLAYSDVNTQTLGTHYLSTVSGGDYVTKELNPEYKISTEAIDGDFSQHDDNIRLPCINFQFDDGAAKDADIVSIFSNHGFTCGFALISNLSSADITRYLGYQSDGFEMICHADNGTGMADATVSPDTIETRLSTSKATLEAAGFDIKGFVTPNSTMANVFKPILRKYFQWAQTIYFGSYTGTGQPYMLPVDGVYNCWRVSLQTSTLANQKAAVDAAIENYGCLTFYGHAAAMDTTDNLTTANLNELLTYIQGKVSAGKCRVGNPSEIIRNYFDVRNDDVSTDWKAYTSTEMELDSRFTTNSWAVYYSEKLKLLYMFFRVSPSENVTGQIRLVKLPVAVDGNALVANESGRVAICYDGYVLLTGSNTWNAGTNYRFSVMCKTR